MQITKSKVLSEDITDFWSELPTLLESGLTIPEALEFLQQGQDNPAMVAMLQTVHAEVEHGKTLAMALNQYPQHFPAFITDILDHAEQEQNLQPALVEIAQYQEASDLAEINLTKRIQTTLIYPIIMLGFIFIFAILLFRFVLPGFQEIFDGFGAKLPAFTKVVFGIITWIGTYWWLLLGLVLIAYFILNSSKGTKEGTSQWDDFMAWLILHLPGFGRTYRTLEMIRSLRTWAFMLARGYSLEQAFDASMQVVHTPTYVSALRHIKETIASGTSIITALQQQLWFPAKTGHILHLAIKSTKAHHLLAKLADRYTQNAKADFEADQKIFGIFMTVILFLIVGSMVIATYLPIFTVAGIL
ncbi:hypothetical protein TI05_01830 [Achromatium sp. WMS3]|nr:hypothetical protein TI05_01830 [Achromatium sp. WMS3]